MRVNHKLPCFPHFQVLLGILYRGVCCLWSHISGYLLHIYVELLSVPVNTVTTTITAKAFTHAKKENRLS